MGSNMQGMDTDHALEVYSPATEELVGRTPIAAPADIDAAVAAADLTVLVQNHKTFDIEDLAGKAQRFFDTRGVAADSDKVERL